MGAREEGCGWRNCAIPNSAQEFREEVYVLFYADESSSVGAISQPSHRGNAFFRLNSREKRNRRPRFLSASRKIFALLCHCQREKERINPEKTTRATTFLPSFTVARTIKEPSRIENNFDPIFNPGHAINIE